MHEGDEILVRLYIDKSNRLCASTRGIYEGLSTNPPYQIGDEVEGRVYEFGHDFGTFLAIDDKYSAMIPKHEDTSHLQLGDVITVEVTGIKEDGKLDVSIRKKAYMQMDDDAERIMDLIESYAAFCRLRKRQHRKSFSVRQDLARLHSNRAVGRLYKERRIRSRTVRIRKAD